MKSKDIALGGLFSALSIVVLFMTYSLPLNTLALLTLCSGIVAVALIRGGKALALLVYVSTCFLSLLFLPPQLVVLYGLFFGCYSIIKASIEALNKLLIEWCLKLIFFNITFFIGLKLLPFVLGFDVLNFDVVSPFIFIIVAQLCFIIFDYALTLLIDTYYRYFERYFND